MSLRNKILLAEDRPRHRVVIPEWGLADGDVYIATLSAADRDDYEKWTFDKADGVNFRARLVARALVDAEGNRIFADEDATALGHKSAAVVSRLFHLACQANGLLKSDIEELEKNSLGAASNGSDVGSHSPGESATPSGC